MTSLASTSGSPGRSGAEETSRRAASEVADDKWGNRALRTGIAARGFVFLVIAYLVARIALGALGGGGGGGTNDSASGPGAAEAVSNEPGGHVVVGLLAVGLLLFAAFSVIDAIRNQGRGEESATRRWFARGLAVWQAAVYGAFGGYCVHKAFSSSSSSSGSSGSADRKHAQWSAEVLRWPAGWLWLGLLGVVLLVVAGVQVYRAIKRKFRDDLKDAQMSDRARAVADVLGVAGNVGRAGAFALVGWFVLQAAWENDPQKGRGVDGSARMLANSSGGPVLLWLLAAGLFAFGLYLFVEARYRRV